MPIPPGVTAGLNSGVLSSVSASRVGFFSAETAETAETTFGFATEHTENTETNDLV
jgi:hypothetical protein